MKDFDEWNILKKVLHAKRGIFVKVREIWWCSLGLNIGSEEDGKHDLFERPVLIIRVLGTDLVQVLPLTTNPIESIHKRSIIAGGRKSYVLMSHLKAISTKRLSRRMAILEEGQFGKILTALRKSFLWNEK